MKLSATTCVTILTSLLFAGGSRCYAQVKGACDLFTQSDAESVLGVPAEPFTPKGISPQQCRFRQVGWQEKAPNNKAAEVYLAPAPTGQYADMLGRIEESVGAAPKRSLQELTDLGDAANWEWSAYDGGVAGLSVYKGSTVAMVGVFGVSDDDAFAFSKKIAAKLLGDTAKTGLVYPGSPAQKGFAMSILPLSDQALGLSGTAKIDGFVQVTRWQDKRQRVIRCVYAPFTSPTTFSFWFGGPPDNFELALSIPAPLRILGDRGVRSCPTTLELAQKQRELSLASQKQEAATSAAGASAAGSTSPGGVPRGRPNTAPAPRNCRQVSTGGVYTTQNGRGSVAPRLLWCATDWPGPGFRREQVEPHKRQRLADHFARLRGVEEEVERMGSCREIQ